MMLLDLDRLRKRNSKGEKERKMKETSIQKAALSTDKTSGEERKQGRPKANSR